MNWINQKIWKSKDSLQVFAVFKTATQSSKFLAFEERLPENPLTFAGELPEREKIK
ncbi:MAG TPA: hypothetical protein VLZ28_07480 [Daejeonella sp.]|nr:hypothetical protein [Daejeonella sp.]